MKMKVFGNIIRTVCGAKNWFGGGVAKALVVTAVVLFACTAWAKTYTQSALTNGRKWWYYLDSSEPTFAKFDVCVGNFIVDYKTGHKEFSLSEVLQGMNLQLNIQHKHII